MKMKSKLLALGLAFTMGVSTPIAWAAVNANPSTTKIMLDGQDAGLKGYEVSGNNYFKLRDLAKALNIGVRYDAATNTAYLDSKLPYVEVEKLTPGNWAKETREAIDAVIEQNAGQKKYVVFDFDNTTAINDVEEALLVYQIEKLDFKIKPSEMYDVLKTQIPDMNKEIAKNEEGKPVTAHQLAMDITKDYRELYKNYKGFGAGGKLTLDEVHKSDYYLDFAAKLRRMYEAVGDNFDHAVSYPWVTYLFTGMTADEVYKLANASHRYWSETKDWGEQTWTSPASLPGESGVITAKFLTGIRVTDELKDLYAKLKTAGIDVYIVSASFIDVIRAAARDPYFGLNVPEENIFAMQLKKDKDGKYLPVYNYDFGQKGKYAQTQGEGKTTVIKNFIAPHYDGAGPVMVFGDSAGDVSMMSSFADTKLGVIFNRYRKTSDPIWKLSVMAADTIGQKNPRYVLQGRDNNTGYLLPTQKSRMLGQTELVLVRPAPEEKK